MVEASSSKLFVALAKVSPRCACCSAGMRANKRPKVVAATPGGCLESFESIRNGALRELLAWEPPSGEVCEAESGCVPRLASSVSYVSAWVGAWLRENRCECASELVRCVWISKACGIALESAGARDSDRGPFANVKVFGVVDARENDLLCVLSLIHISEPTRPY